MTANMLSCIHSHSGGDEFSSIAEFAYYASPYYAPSCPTILNNYACTILQLNALLEYLLRS